MWLHQDINLLLPSLDCSECKNTWQARVSQRALLKAIVYSNKPPRGNHRVTVWHCPIDPNKYSFKITFGSGIVGFEQFEGYPYHCGAFDTPEAALEAGRKFVLEG